MRIPRYYLLFTLLVTGASVLVIEIVGARIISPHFGVSLYVWSSLITVTLISLAIGYWLGGIVADAAPVDERLFTLIFTSALCLAVLPLVKTPVLSSMGSLGLRMGALMSASVLFAPPLILLSMVTPYAIRLSAKTIEGVGRTTGALYAVSTIGSFFGALTTGFFLIPLLHVDKIVYLVSLLLACVAVAPWIAYRRLLKVGIAILFILLCVVFLFHSMPLRHIQGMKVLLRTDSPYGEIRVVEGTSGRVLLINGIMQGRANPSGYPVDRCFYFMDALIQGYAPDVRDSLMVGLGTGALPKILQERRIRVDSVEIDPVIVDVAKKYFGFEGGLGRLAIADARHFIESTYSSYDYIFLDAYASEMLPYHLFSRESFAAMKRILREHGILTINLHDFKDIREALLTRSVVTTLRTVFPHVLAFEIQPWYDSRLRNIAIAASKTELTPRGTISKNLHAPEVSEIRIPEPVVIPPEMNGVLISDGYNPVEKIYAPIAESMRKNTLIAFPKEILLP